MPQSYFMPHLPSALVVLAFLGTGFFLFTALLAALVTLVLGRHRLARWLSLASLGGGALYLAVLSDQRLPGPWFIRRACRTPRRMTP